MRNSGFSGMYEEVEIRVGESIDDAVERGKLRLKERLWAEIWRDEIDLPGAKVSVSEDRAKVRVEI